MPRIKALTTGSIPSFLDMVLNIAESDTSSSLANQDSWIAQMKAKNTGKLAMYGDDTWLKLFPNTFDRADGTSSFFVSDYTDVDHNVTRHVPSELLNDDWNVMIMHYLGLDHIGHKSGSSRAHRSDGISINMVPKQQEMDEVVKHIYAAFQSMRALKNSLLVLCGDHGMTDGGNHGGSAPGETSPAMVFVSPKLKAVTRGANCPTHPRRDLEYYDLIEQSDIAPTLAGLLGFPVPLNNLGVFIPQLLPIFKNGEQSLIRCWRLRSHTSEDDQMELLYRNALELANIVKETFPHEIYTAENSVPNCKPPSTTTDELACLWATAASSLKERPWSVKASQAPLLKVS
ncbi:MAG: hypothetical protein Q9162_005504 [Coniocarpon cinnabarinum]